MNAMRRRSRYRLGATIALAYGAIAALLAQFGDVYVMQVALITLAVLIITAVSVFRSKD